LLTNTDSKIVRRSLPILLPQHPKWRSGASTVKPSRFDDGWGSWLMLVWTQTKTNVRVLQTDKNTSAQNMAKHPRNALQAHWIQADF